MFFAVEELTDVAVTVGSYLTAKTCELTREPLAFENFCLVVVDKASIAMGIKCVFLDFSGIFSQLCCYLPLFDLIYLYLFLKSLLFHHRHFQTFKL